MTAVPSHRARFAPVLVALVSVVLIAAAAPSDVVGDLTRQGYFIETGSSATDACVSRSVADARSAGGNLSIVVLADEPGGGATTFAGATLSQLTTNGTVLVVAPETVGWESQDDLWSPSELNAALDVALDGSSDNDVVRSFVNTLVGLDETCSAAGSGGSATSQSGGGMGWILLVILVVGIGVVVFMVSRSSKKTTQRRRNALVAGVDDQIADIANDILALEAEVRQSGDQTAIGHFDEATKQFSTASDRLTAATTSTEMMDLSYDLDVTIWHLDAAEAVLDGHPIPDKPEKPVVPTTPAPSSTPPSVSEPSSSSTKAPTHPPESLPEYQRRPSRSSSYGTGDLVKAMLAMQAMKGVGGLLGGKGSTSSPGWRSSSGGGSTGSGGSRSSRRSSGGRTRGGGRRRG